MGSIVRYLLTGHRGAMLGLTLGGWLTMQVASCEKQPAEFPVEAIPVALPAAPPDRSALNPDNLRALQRLLTDPVPSSP